MEYERKPVNQVRPRTINDYLEIQNAEGMPGLVDSTIALDFLLGVKSGIRNCAIALTEIADLEARASTRKLLDAEIELHGEVSKLMMSKGWFHPYDVREQFQLDRISTRAALQIAGLQLFPGDTGRLGTFATPNY